MNSKLFVGNLAFSTTEEELRELFCKAGIIGVVMIPMDRATERPRGFAVVEMDSPAEAQKAITQCNGQMLIGRRINVNEARPSEQRSGPRSEGATRESPLRLESAGTPGIVPDYHRATSLEFRIFPRWNLFVL